MPVKRSVAVLIRGDTAPDAVLLVQRPHDDDDLPDAWGLPAATLTGDESHADAARRAGRDKLGLELRIGRVLNEGSRQRSAYRLDMQLVEAWIRSGKPNVDAGTDSDAADDTPARHDANPPKSDASRPAGITRYQAWRWGRLKDLRPAAERGSLCSILALRRPSDDTSRH
jgi:ADP-ribose pyrophosphatase YjhB (NUDIX family)